MNSRPAFDYRYSIIPGGAVTDPNISMRDLQVLALLGRHTKRNGWCWRSQVEMADELRCGRATVGRSIKRLVAAGWLEQEALPRGRAVLVPGEQPFSAFKYRVKIDRDDEAEGAKGEVPNIEHPQTEGDTSPNNGQGVPAIGGQGVPTQVGTLKKDPLEGPPLTLSPARATVLAGWPEIWQAFLTWPNLPDTASEERTRAALVRLLDELPPPDELTRLIRAQGIRLRAGGGKRGGWATAPHNWLERDRGWRDLALAEAAKRDAADLLAEQRDRVLAALGADMLAKLRRAGLRESEITALDGVQFHHGLPPRFTGGNLALTVLRQYHPQLCEIIDAGLRIENAGRRRA